jgi:hypothetical protein
VGVSIANLVAFSAPFTYVVRPDGRLVVNLGEGTLDVLLGAGAGIKGTTSPRIDVFQLVENDQAFTTAPKAGIEQETVRIDGALQYRLCARSGFRGIIK